MPDLETIENSVQSDRRKLAASLDALSQTVAPTTVSDQVSTVVSDYGGELGRQAWQAARTNPAGFALLGAGLGLLVMGTGTRPEHPNRPTPAATPPRAAMAGFDARVAAADAAMKEEMTGMTDETAPSAAAMRAALHKGLDKLPDSARHRVLQARKAALSAQEKIEAQTRRMAAQTRTFHHQQPLAVGALALGMGALIGALLPSSRREDELLGQQRDALMARAQEALNAEMDRLSARASATLETSSGSATSGRV